MSDDITQIGADSNNNIFRGIERVFIIPFNTTRAITASENRHGWNLELPQAGIAASWGASANSGLAPVSSYCYPPSLWYWTSSRLKTTNNESIINQYVSSNPTWDSILAQYTSGSTVIPGVASTAVREPLQYGVAQLRLCLNDAVSEGGTDNLLDSKATAINVSNSNFPLTGVHTIRPHGTASGNAGSFL